MSVTDIVRIAGAVPVLAASALTSTRALRIPPKILAVLNLGAGALALNSAAHHAWPSMLLNAVWFLVAAVTVVRSTVRRSERDDGAQSRPELTATTTPATALGR